MKSQTPPMTNSPSPPAQAANVLMTSGGILIQAPPCASAPGEAQRAAPAKNPATGD